LGPSAHSFDGNSRRWNESEWTRYLALVEEGADPVAGSETLSDEQRMLEAIMLGLRTSAGVKLDMIDTNRVADLSATGWFAVDGKRLRLTTEGWLRLETILSRLTTSAQGG
jgi:oxygen-independent coproporphyrinogen-3 oxidase